MALWEKKGWPESGLWLISVLFQWYYCWTSFPLQWERNPNFRLETCSFFFIEQECIRVGCVPSAAVAAGGGAVSQHALGRGRGVHTNMHWARGCLAKGWGCLPREGVSGQGCLPGGCLLHPLTPRTEWQTTVRKHYLAATTLQTVKNYFFAEWNAYNIYKVCMTYCIVILLSCINNQKHCRSQVWFMWSKVIEIIMYRCYYSCVSDTILSRTVLWLNSCKFS